MPSDPSAVEHEFDGAPEFVAGRRPRRRLRRLTIVLVLVILVGAGMAGVVSVPYYAITPGTALDVGSFISVPSSRTHHHTGGVYLTDVELVPLRALDYLFYKLNGDDDVVPTAALIGPATTTQYDEQGVIDMATARQAATVVALKTLGYPVSATPDGVADYQPEPGSPAALAFSVGDVITSIDGHPTPSLQELEVAIQSRSPGTTVTVGFHFLASKSEKEKAVRLGTAEVESGAAVCVPFGAHSRATPVVVAGGPVACLGLYLEQIFATSGAPFGVSIGDDGIIGPSAGLAYTLGLIEKLDADDLTGGHRVAATGTMSIDGSVGDVGGVAQKTVAVRNADAALFLVPPQELSVAKAHAGSHLKVVAVNNIKQAIAALRDLGGRVARSP